MDDIAQTQRRAQAYWFVDGLAETVGGAAMAAIGGLMLLAAATGDDGYAVASSMVLLAAIPLCGRLVGRLKERLTYPRTGYLGYRAPTGPRRWVTLGAVLVVVVGSVVILAVTGDDGSSGVTVGIPAGFGAAACAALVFRARRTGIRRFWLDALLVALAGSCAVVLGLEPITGIGLLLAVLGVGSALTGAVALRGHLGRR